MKHLLMLLCFAYSTNALAQPYIDSFNINPNTSFLKSSSPKSFFADGYDLYFSASDSTHGRELWVMRANSNFPQRLTDISSGRGDAMNTSQNKIIAKLSGKLYFTATDGLDKELWMYDGTSSKKVADIDTSTAGGHPSEMLAFNGKLYFSANTVANGRELWVYDPTSNKAKIVKDIRPGRGSSVPMNLTVYKNKIYYSATDSTHGYELRSYDPTTGNESLAFDINTGNSSGLPSNFLVVDGKLYFTARDNAHGTELYSYDGSTATRLTDIAPGTSSGISFTSNLTAIGNTIYFGGQTSFSTGTQLYKYENGNASLVHTINQTGSAQVGDLVAMGNEIFFKATDSTHGIELWKYDGTNTSMVKDLTQGSSSSFIDNITTANSSIFFSAGSFSGNYGNELYRYSNHPVGIQNEAYDINITAYPNPINETLHLDIKQEKSNTFTVQIVDLQGRKVYQNPNKFYNKLSQKIDIKLSNIPSGTYVLSIMNKSGTVLYNQLLSKH